MNLFLSSSRFKFTLLLTYKSSYIWAGDYSMSETQDPIPNSNVKPHSADGTLLLSMGE